MSDTMTKPASETSGHQIPAPVTFARGDGIGPEIMDATLEMLEAAGAQLALEEIRIGEAVYESGITSGIEPNAWDSLRRTGVFLKAPITTPQGKGYKSLNVTVRKTMGLFANVRPCPTFHPYVATSHPDMDVVIIRENEEDTYGGIEHRQTAEVTQCLKLITRPGSEKIVRYAFDYARQHGRKRVTCFTKDNIMKITDGLFHRVFDEIAAEYPEIESDHQIIDIGTARFAKDPTQYDVMVLPNLYGDIISDVAAELAGSVGLAGSANIGDSVAMFEAIHGSAPDIAGKGVANPSGLLHGAILMLDHVGQPDPAGRLHNAWLRTIEDGIHTADVKPLEPKNKPVDTRGFTKAVIDRLGEEPRRLPKAVHQAAPHSARSHRTAKRPAKELRGVDVFLDWDEDDRNPDALGKKLEDAAPDGIMLKMITNRGVKVYPEGQPETFCTDHWRCRFLSTTDGGAIEHTLVIKLLSELDEAGFDFIKTEHLYAFDGQRTHSGRENEPDPAS
jgi:isocitrate dehydrogenase